MFKKITEDIATAEHLLSLFKKYFKVFHWRLSIVFHSVNGSSLTVVILSGAHLINSLSVLKFPKCFSDYIGFLLRKLLSFPS